jgi:hypothetical protein
MTLLLLFTALLQQSVDFVRHGRDTLRGHTNVSVLVERLNPDIESAGLHADDIRTDVELKLRLPKIPVIPADPIASLPYLYVNVSVMRSRTTPLYAYNVSVQFKQLAKLENGTSAAGATWDGGSIGMVGALNIQQIRDSVKEEVDRFINDWLAVHSK